MGQLIPIGAFLIAIAFFVIHQTRPTGFFTNEFGTLGAVLFYAVFVFGIVPNLVRLFVGRKNPARLFEAAGMVVFFVAQFYLLLVFPFDFSHFADPLPRSLEFLLSWVSPTIAKWVLGIGVLGSVFFSIYTFILYISVREQLSKTKVVDQQTDS